MGNVNLAPPGRQIVLGRFGGLYLVADPRSLPLGASPLNHDVDFQVAGVGTRAGLTVVPMVFPPSHPGALSYLKSARLADIDSTPVSALRYAMAWDSGNGCLLANYNTPGDFLSSGIRYQGLLPGSRAVSETINDREYFGLSGLDPEGSASGAGYDSPFTYRPANSVQQRISQGPPGGTLAATFSNDGAYPLGTLAAGPRYVACMFLTSNGYLTPLSTPLLVNVPSGMNTISFNTFPISSPPIQSLVFAITLPNAGIGGPYYYLSDPVFDGINNVTWPSTAYTPPGAGPFVIAVSDIELAAGINVTTPGNNRIQVRSVGEFIKPILFQGRCCYLGERAKVDQFQNLDFLGGMDASGQPLGWTETQTAGTVWQTSLGQVQFQNPTASTINPYPNAPTDYLSQTGYQTAFKTPILSPQISYSVRVVASVLAPGPNQKIVIDTYSTTLGGVVAQCSFALTGTPTEFVGHICPRLSSVPSDLILRVWIQNHAPSSTVNVNRVYPFAEETPGYDTQLNISYVQDYESVDAITGVLDLSEYTNEPLTNAYRFLDTLYVCTRSQTFQTPGGATEPDEWDISETANASGCIGPLAQDAGEEFSIVAEQKGVYIFDGGDHVKISQEIQPLWNQIYWPSAYKTWVRLDLVNQRILVGVPMVTPNAYVPDAPANATPSECNVILMCNYLMVPTGSALAEAPGVHVSSFTGQLLGRELTRKWTAWYVPANHAAWITQPDRSQQLWLVENGATIFNLDSSNRTDNGAAIVSRYMAATIPSEMEEAQFQLGSARKQFNYVTTLLEGAGSLNLNGLLETPANPTVTLIKGVTLANPALDDQNAGMNLVGNRLFLDYKSDGLAGTWWKLMRAIVSVAPAAQGQVSGK